MKNFFRFLYIRVFFMSAFLSAIPGAQLCLSAHAENSDALVSPTLSQKSAPHAAKIAAPSEKPLDNSENSGINFVQTADEISRELERAINLAVGGHIAEARGLLSDAYFELFEGSGFEKAIGAQSPALKQSLEAQFSALRSRITQTQNREELAPAAGQLSGQIKAVALEISNRASASSVFGSSFLIIFREGFEAILIITAIVTLLIKIGQTEILNTVRSSVLWALGASLVTALAFQYVFHITHEQQELMEGLTMAMAASILFFVGHWLISQSESAKWQKFIRSQLSESLSTNNKRALWLTCFLAVYREGAETVLFYQALWAGSPGHSLPFFTGLLVGLIALVVVYIGFKKGALIIPMKPFFRVTSTFLYFLSFLFVGRALVELQAGGYLQVTEISWMPTVGTLGIYPTAEHLVAQGVMLLIFALSLIKVFLGTRREPLASPVAESPTV